MLVGTPRDRELWNEHQRLQKLYVRVVGFSSTRTTCLNFVGHNIATLYLESVHWCEDYHGWIVTTGDGREQFPLTPEGQQAAVQFLDRWLEERGYIDVTLEEEPC